MDITARIENKRLALMAMIAPWFAFVLFYWGRGAKPLPQRLAAFALETVGKMEKAAGYLLIASVYSALSTPKRTAHLESMAFCLAQNPAHMAQTNVTIASLHARLFAIWRFLNALQRIARHLARRLSYQHVFRALGLITGQSMPQRFTAAQLATAQPVHHEKTGPP